MQLTARRAVLVLVAAAAVTAVLAGLARLGVVVAWGPRFAFDHGSLFVLGVFATVIGLERAVALAHAWALAVPMVAAAAAAAMLAGLSWAAWGSVASLAGLVAINALIVRRHSAAHTWLMLLGAGVLFFGSILWARGHPIFAILPTWLAFFVLTIAAERLELSRLAPTPRWARRLLVAVALLIAALACLAGLASATTGTTSLRTLGGAIAVLGAWQLRYDIARRTVRQPGLPRFVAVGVLLGAAWLVVTGALLISRGLPPAGPIYDAVLHAIAIGFVLSMLFAHAPIVLPSVAPADIGFSRILYLPLAVLHLGLVARIAGDLAGDYQLRRSGAVANALALALYAFAAAVSRWLAGRRNRSKDD